MAVSNPPSKDIMSLIDGSAGGLSLTDGTNLFRNSMPSEPDNCVVLFDYATGQQELFQMANPNVQIKVRNRNPDTAYELCQEIKHALHDKYNDTTINGTRYIRIHCVLDIMYLKQDELNSFLYSLNFRAQRSEIT